MTWATWRIDDDCLRGAPRIRIERRGPDPFGFIPKVLDVVQRVLGIKKTDMWESDFRWDIWTAPVRFMVRNYAIKTFDPKTTMQVEITFNGEQPEDPKESHRLLIDIAARLRTRYGLKGVFQQSWFYRLLLRAHHFSTYARERERYLTACTELVERLAAEIRKLI
ncbi:MAG: hypothetical protein QMD14_01970 [Candidatus Aenigmarchaeota archaeon]|nr:hypothetical protein [Candidatus Aenigmarchaeota archaeon]